ncbi:MAG: hypothetical protein ACLGIY_20480 [Betaproteobacteria bacterium]
MNNTQTALKAFVESLTDAQVRQFVAHGGFIGLGRGTDLSNIEAGDLLFIGNYLENVGRVSELFMEGCVFSSQSQTAGLEAGDLKPTGGKGGDLDLSARFTARFVKEARGLLAGAIADGADVLEDGMARAQSKVIATRLFYEIVDLYEDAAGLALQGLVKGRGNVAVFRRNGQLAIGFSAGSRALPDHSDSDVAFYANCAIGHELFSDTCASWEDLISAWLTHKGICDSGLTRLIEASREDEQGYELGFLQDAVLAHSDAIEALRNEVVAALKKDAEHHKSELADTVLAWADAQGQE